MQPVPVEQPWVCDACGASLAFTHLSDADAKVVKAGVLRQHRKLAPECPADSVPPIRFREREKGRPGSGVQTIMD